MSIDLDWQALTTEDPDSFPVFPAGDTSWMDRALCVDTWPDAFFPVGNGSQKPAKAVCRNCPVRTDCLEYALAHDEPWGIWGGFSEEERERLSHLTAAERAAIIAAVPAGVPVAALLPVEGRKQCTKCGDVKDLEPGFSRDAKAPDGFRTVCKVCAYVAERKRRAARKEAEAA